MLGLLPPPRATIVSTYIHLLSPPLIVLRFCFTDLQENIKYYLVVWAAHVEEAPNYINSMSVYMFFIVRLGCNSESFD